MTATMMLAVDVDYRLERAVVAGVLFAQWEDAAPTRLYERALPTPGEYEPGAFYKRELPCVLALLELVREPVELVVIDGYVHLGEGHPGLGLHLYRALGERVPVVGVAKTSFRGSSFAQRVARGEEAKNPLFVTAAGMDEGLAAERVRAMHGPYRVPTLLRLVDHACRSSAAT